MHLCIAWVRLASSYIPLIYTEASAQGLSLWKGALPCVPAILGDLSTQHHLHMAHLLGCAAE